MMKKFAKYMPMSGFPAKKGCALQVSISRIKDTKISKLFIEMAPQVKEKPPSGSEESPFDWGQKIFIALKEEEVGSMLSTLKCRTPETNIIHKYPIDGPKEAQKTSILKLKVGEYEGKTNWGFSLKQKVGNGEEVSYALYLQPEEAEILEVILTECIRRMYLLSE